MVRSSKSAKSRKSGAPATVWIHGVSGRVGKHLHGAVMARPEIFQLIGGSSHVFEGEVFHQGKKVTTKLLVNTLQRVQGVFDFSSPEGNEVILEAFRSGDLKGKAVLLGTTGLDDDQLLRWRSAAEAYSLQLLIAPNTSLGVLAVLQASTMLAKILHPQGFDIEIVETHHRQKKDSPSGTAKILASNLVDSLAGLRLAPSRRGARIAGEVGIASMRGGGVYGEHEVRFLGDHEEVSVSHHAFDRALFAEGALVLMRWLLRQPPGIFNLQSIDLTEIF